MNETNNKIVMMTADRQIDRRILLSAESLKKVGWDVVIVAMPLDGESVNEIGVIRIGNEMLEFQREKSILRLYQWIRNHLPMNSKLMNWFKRLAWQFFVDHETFYYNIFKKNVSNLNPKVIIANDLPMLPAAKMFAEQTGSYLVYDSHELYCEQEFSDREKRIWQKIERKYINLCNSIITVNRSIADELKIRYNVNHVNVIYNAECISHDLTNNHYFHDFFNLTEDKKIILFQGGVSKNRNLENLVESIQYLKNDSIILVILGDGYYSNHLKKLANKFGVKGRVLFHSAVPQNKLLALTVSADAGIIPYQPICLNNYYCTPNKLFEFIAAGIPIAATNLPEIQKIVQHNNIGLVGKTKTSKEIANLIDDLFSDYDRYCNWIKNMVLVRQTICWQQEEKKLVGIFEAFR